MSTEEEDYESLKESCEKLSGFIEETQDKEKIDPHNKNRLNNIKKELVKEASTLINKKVNQRLFEIKKRVDPLLQETQEIIDRINKKL